MNDGPPNKFNLVSPWSIRIVIGASIGITVFLVVFLLFTPTAGKLVRTIRQMQQNPQQPPPAELKLLQKRLSMIPPLAVTLLLSTEVFMVAAAQF
jgi:gas vesicle protein